MIVSLALRELVRSKWQLVAVGFILAVGFTGLLFSTALKTSVGDYLQLRSRQILSADLAISSTRQFENQEIKELREAIGPLREARETEFVTMARGKSVATLTEIKAVDGDYPIFGVFREKGGAEISNASELLQDKVAWVFPEVLTQLGVELGETVTIGDTGFRIVKVVEDGPGLVRAGGFAPRIYIGRSFVEETGLTQFGSQVFHRFYVELPKGMTSETGAALIKARLQSPDIFLRTPDDSVQGFERFFRFFNLYLSTVTLIVFALSWTGAFYILQIFILDRMKKSAVLMAFGAGRVGASFVHVVQILALMVLCLIVAACLVSLAALFINRVFSDSLPRDFVFAVRGSDLLVLTIAALASSVAFCTPVFARIYSMNLQRLLNENSMGEGKSDFKTAIWIYIPMAVIFLGVSIWLMDTYMNALRVAGGMVITALLGWLAGKTLFNSLFRAFKTRPGRMRLVATNLSRSRFGPVLCFIALLFVVMILNLVPHLLKSAVAEIEPLKGKEVPALFLFNIPESSVEEVTAFVTGEGSELRYVSPMVLGRLMKVNGEQVKNDQFQRFPVRLTFRENTIPSEKIIEGTPFPGPWKEDSGELPLISIERNFANRNDLKIGDLLEFDIQGVPVEGRIFSVREVKWTDFNPNFFMVFQPGVIDDAPKTYIANVNMDKSDEAKVRLQFEMISKFPDLSVIDIGRTVQRVLEIAQSVLGPVRAAAWIAVTMSFVILLGVISHNLSLRRREIDIEKMMGADASLIRGLIVGEYALLSVVAVIVGFVSALALTWVVTSQIFKISPKFDWLALAGSGGVAILATAILSYYSSTRVLSLRGASKKL